MTEVRWYLALTLAIALLGVSTVPPADAAKAPRTVLFEKFGYPE